MERLHLLLINQYFPPDTAATAKMAALVAGALAREHRVTVLCGRPSYDPTERHPYYLGHREVRDNLVVERVGSATLSRHRMRGRLGNYLSYFALAVPRALAFRADAVVAMTDPPGVGVAAAFVAALKRVPFIYNIRDLHPDMAVQGGLIRGGLVTAVWERLHRWALRRADRVIVLGDDMRERIIAKGVQPARVAVVRDGAAIPDVQPARDHPVVQEIRSGFRFVVLHAGNLGFYGAWDTLLKAADFLNGKPVGMIFVGGGAAEGRLRQLAGSNSRVRFLPFRPAAEVPYVMTAGDLHVVTVRRGLEGVVVPSKLYGILAAGRPVLAVAPETSDVARIVRRYDCGFVADPDDPQAVAAAIHEAMQSPERLAAMGARSRAAARGFEQSVQLQRYVRVVEEAMMETQQTPHPHPLPRGEGI